MNTVTMRMIYTTTTTTTTKKDTITTTTPTNISTDSSNENLLDLEKTPPITDPQQLPQPSQHQTQQTTDPPSTLQQDLPQPAQSGTSNQQILYSYTFNRGMC